eukprot:9019070-Karenia_brevis.AAC.1
MEDHTHVMPMPRNPEMTSDSSMEAQMRSAHDVPVPRALPVQMSIFGCDRMPTPPLVYRTPDNIEAIH